MENYKNLLLLVDWEFYDIDAVIYTNENDDTIEREVQKARAIWDETTDNISLMEFVENYLKDKFGDIKVVRNFRIVCY